MPFKRIGESGLAALSSKIAKAKSGINLPAYDYPAMKNVLFAYSGNLFWKKSFSITKLSLAVLSSLNT